MTLPVDVAEGVGNGPVDHQVLPRGADDRAVVRYRIDPAHASLVQVEVTVGSTPVDTDVQVQGTEVVVRIPVGGPYEVALSAGPVLHRAQDVLVGDIWVLAGQSNMAGGGALAEVKPAPPRCSMLSFDGTWKPAVDPLHRLFEAWTLHAQLIPDIDPARTREEAERTFREVYDTGGGPVSGGVGPGTSFAREIMRLTDVPVGLVPCALGGSPLDMWRRDWQSQHGAEDNLFGYMVERARRCGAVRGVLWYQGESDTSPELAATYFDRFRAFVDDVRRQLDAPELPFITVQLGKTTTWPDVLVDYWAQIRDVQRRAADVIDNVAVVAAADLSLGDGLHLDTAAHDTLGVRLARAATAFTPGASSSFTRPRLAGVESDGSTVTCRIGGVNGRLQGAGDLTGLFRSDAAVEAVTVHAGAIVVTLDAPPTWLGYCLGYADETVVVDEAGLPVPAFGPVEVAPAEG